MLACCALATSGNTVAPPTTAMNSRRLIGFALGPTRQSTTSVELCVAAKRRARLPQRVMNALCTPAGAVHTAEYPDTCAMRSQNHDGPARQKSAARDLGCSWRALSIVDVDRFQFDFANGECCQW
jgi:hypothetical protein